MWIQSVAGVGYLFGGSMSPAIKAALGYNEKQIALLGVAKNLSDAIGFVSGALSEVSPSWVVLLVGAAQNLVGYGVLWLVVTGLLPNLPLWMVSGDNGNRHSWSDLLFPRVQQQHQSIHLTDQIEGPD